MDALLNDPDFHAVDRQFFGNLKYNKALTDKAALQLKGFSQGYVYSADEANENGGPSYQLPLTARVPGILRSARLDTFSIDKLKIDKSFVSDLSQRRQENKAIIQAIIPLRRTLSIQDPLQQLDA